MWRGSLGAAYLFPPLSSGGASIASPCPVSTSRSSNRTCGFPASGSPTNVAFRHTPPPMSRQLHLKAKLVPGSPGLSLEVIGLRHSPIRCSLPKRVRSQAPFLRRHYPASLVLRACPPPQTARPVPHGFPVGVSPPPLGLPVLRRTSLYIHAVASTPAGPLGARVAVFFQRRRPSPANHRVGSRIAVFEACSAFTARYGLHTRGVALRPFTPEASEISLPTSPLRLLPTEATLVGWDFHPLKIRAFSRRTISGQLSAVSKKPTAQDPRESVAKLPKHWAVGTPAYQSVAKRNNSEAGAFPRCPAFRSTREWWWSEGFFPTISLCLQWVPKITMPCCP